MSQQKERIYQVFRKPSWYVIQFGIFDSKKKSRGIFHTLIIISRITQFWNQYRVTLDS